MKQGEIWIINLNPTIGAEMQKLRPVIIVNDDALGKLPLKVIIPLTDWKVKFDIASWMIKIEPNKKNGLSKISSADCFQIRSVSIDRFKNKLGRISIQQQEQIKLALKKVLTIE